MDFKIVQGENSNFNEEKACDRGYVLGYLLLNLSSLCDADFANSLCN